MPAGCGRVAVLAREPQFELLHVLQIEGKSALSARRAASGEEPFATLTAWWNGSFEFVGNLHA